MRRAALLCLACPTAVFVAAASASADDTGEPIRLDYTAASDCPDLQAFEASVRSRTTRARFVEEGQSRTFQVSIHDGSHPAGQLVVHRGDAIEGARSVTGSSCAQVADAMALVVALAIDPSALAGAAPAAPPSASSSSPETSPADTSPPSPSSATPSPPPQAAAPTAMEPESPSTPGRSEKRPHTLFIGADADITGGVAPSALVSVEPLLGWRSPGRGLIAPSFRASFLHTSSGAFEASGGSASFTWTAGRLDGCLLSWPPSPAHLLACARLEGGVLDASSSDVPGAHSAERGWFAAGAVIRAEWEFLGTLFVEADVAPMVRLTTDRFLLLPDATIYQVPPVGLGAEAGLGVHFL